MVKKEVEEDQSEDKKEEEAEDESGDEELEYDEEEQEEVNTIIVKIFVLINWMKPQFANADSKITAGQQTISGHDKHLSWQTFGLPVILTGHVKKRLEKNTTITFQEDKHLFALYVFACWARSF